VVFFRPSTGGSNAPDDLDLSAFATANHLQQWNAALAQTDRVKTGHRLTLGFGVGDLLGLLGLFGLHQLLGGGFGAWQVQRQQYPWGVSIFAPGLQKWGGVLSEHQHVGGFAGLESDQ